MEFNLFVTFDEKVQIIWQHNFIGQATLPGKETRVFELLRQVAQCRVAVLIARGVLTSSHDDSSVAKDHAAVTVVTPLSMKRSYTWRGVSLDCRRPPLHSAAADLDAHRASFGVQQTRHA